MQVAISSMQEALKTAGGSVGLTALFLAGLLSLWYGKYYKKAEEGYLFWYSIIMLFIVINPFYQWIIRNFAPSLSKDNIYSWILPVIPVIVCCGVRAVGFLETKQKKVIFTVGLAGLLLLAATTSYSSEKVELKADKESYEEEILVYDHILEYMNDNNMNYVLLWGEDDIMESAREYSGFIRLLYGKDMWIDGCLELSGTNFSENQLYAYYLMNQEFSPVDVIIETALESECDVVVLDCNKVSEEFENEYYTQYFSTKSYVVLTKQGRE